MAPTSVVPRGEEFEEIGRLKVVKSHRCGSVGTGGATAPPTKLLGSN